jgi:putative transposase
LLLPAVCVYNVTSRGVARQGIYADDDDRNLFVSLLRRAQRRWRWQLPAYCLMTNHYHLVVTTELERLSRGMHLLNFRYAQTFNARHGRVGHLFQNRFDARAIEGDEHFIASCAYVLANAERAGIHDWPWRGGELFAELSYAVACTGESAGAHEQSGETSPLRPFSRR